MRSISALLLLVLAGSILAVAGRADAAVHVCDGTPVTGNVTLHADYTCAGQSGIVIGKAGITIDLGGHTITGNGASSTYGIDDLGGFANVTVLNGTLTHFVEGVDAVADGIHLRRLTLSGNSDAGAFVTGDSFRMSSSLLAGNQGDGGFIDGDGARVASSRISGNAGTHGYGFWIFGNNGHVSTSTFSGNNGPDSGLRITGDYARVWSTRAYGNEGNGIAVSGNFAKIGQLRGRPASDRNHADANGFSGGTSDGQGLGIDVTGYPTKGPVGHNEASGNDDPAECSPVALC